MKQIILFFTFLMCCSFVNAQPNTVVATSNNGAFLSKSGPHQQVSGVPFTYDIHFTVPAGATQVTLTDDLPDNLLFMGVTSQHGSQLTTPAPTNLANNQLVFGPVITLNLGGNPSAAAYTGLLQISVMFPNGTTCDGERALNDAELSYIVSGDQYNVTTPELVVYAIASNKWTVTKNLISRNWQNVVTADCNHRTFVQRNIMYEFVITNGTNPNGQIDVDMMQLIDRLDLNGGRFTGVYGNPPAPTALQTFQNITPVTPAAGTSTATNSPVTFEMPNGLGHIDPLNPLKTYRFWAEIEYDSDGCKENKVELHGELGRDAKCAPFGKLDDDSEVVRIDTALTPGIVKGVRTQGVPGCPILYFISMSGGSTGLSFDANNDFVDNLPPGVTFSAWPDGTGGNGSTYQYHPNLWATYDASTNAITFDFTGPLNVGINGLVLNWYCTVNATATPLDTICNQTVITDAFNVQYPVRACFEVAKPTIRLCVSKEVVNRQLEYAIGDVVKYRVRIQNTGTEDLAGGTVVSDALSNNLALVPGSIQFYSCPDFQLTNASVTTPLSIAHTTGTPTAFMVPNNFTLQDAIPQNCDGFYPEACYNSALTYAQNGSPIFYYLDFDAVVLDSAATGLTGNTVQIRDASGVNLSAPASTAPIQIVSNPQFEVQKGVSTDGTTFTSSVEIDGLAGTDVFFQTTVNNTNLTGTRRAPYIRVGMADLLPGNLLTGTDMHVLDRTQPHGNRNGQFELQTNTDVTASAGAISDRASLGVVDNVALEPLGLNGLRYFAAPIQNAGAGGWTSVISLPANQQNIAYDFRADMLPSYAAQFGAELVTAAQPLDSTCNSVAANIAIKRMVGTAPFYAWEWAVINTPIESELACINARPTQMMDCCSSAVEITRCERSAGINYMYVDVANLGATNICSVVVNNLGTNPWFNESVTGDFNISNTAPGQYTVTPSGSPFVLGEHFNLEWQYQGFLNGGVEVVINYCAGSCEPDTFRFTPTDIPMGGNTSGIALKERGDAPKLGEVVYFQLEALPNPTMDKPVKRIQISLPDGTNLQDHAILAASGATLSADGQSGKMLPVKHVLQGPSSVMFHLPRAVSKASEPQGTIQIVFKVKPPKVRAQLIGEDGSVLFDGNITL